MNENVIGVSIPASFKSSVVAFISAVPQGHDQVQDQDEVKHWGRRFEETPSLRTMQIWSLHLKFVPWHLALKETLTSGVMQ